MLSAVSKEDTMSGSVYVQPRAPHARDFNMYFIDTSPKTRGPPGTLYDMPELSPSQSVERSNSTSNQNTSKKWKVTAILLTLILFCLLGGITAYVVLDRIAKPTNGKKK